MRSKWIFFIFFLLLILIMMIYILIFNRLIWWKFFLGNFFFKRMILGNLFDFLILLNFMIIFLGYFIFLIWFYLFLKLLMLNCLFFFNFNWRIIKLIAIDTFFILSFIRTFLLTLLYLFIIFKSLCFNIVDFLHLILFLQLL